MYSTFVSYVSSSSIAGLDFLADGGADFEHAITVTGESFPRRTFALVVSKFNSFATRVNQSAKSISIIKEFSK